MNFDKTKLVGSADFAILVMNVARERGYGAGHRLLAGTLNRRVYNLLASGHIETVRINGRYFADPALAEKAASLLGMTALEAPASVAA